MYRIVELGPDYLPHGREVGCFECPYSALRELRGAVRRSDGQAWLQLIDPNGVILVDTIDVLEECKPANANLVH